MTRRRLAVIPVAPVRRLRLETDGVGFSPLDRQHTAIETELHVVFARLPRSRRSTSARRWNSSRPTLQLSARRRIAWACRPAQPRSGLTAGEGSYGSPAAVPPSPKVATLGAPPTASSPRPSTRAFCLAVEMWRRTVTGEMPNRSAIATVDRPRRSMPSTCLSRGVKFSPPSVPPWSSRTKASTIDRETAASPEITASTTLRNDAGLTSLGR